ncbi:unnamed protein product [Mycena citricolor]|uniref:Alcohol dehydrogenase n=1 Tax=Mycena citricolor TaxID=2018698 RepID=A0AAD2JZF8_9AGAR|nr:unnamed protein product [Mycena citricolor]
MMKAIRFYPPAFDIRVESVPVPRIQHPDDAIVKVALAGLCGSDLHIYRGHGGVTQVHTCGHEFVGEVVELGSSFEQAVDGRPALYAKLKIGDKVVSPFTSNCGECSVCRLGYTCRCPSGFLFGSPSLDGGQAQYVRVPYAGGTLFNLSDPSTWSSSMPAAAKEQALSAITDSSLLLLADILPTGVFAALQALNHPKVLPAITGKPWPSMIAADSDAVATMKPEDQILTFAIIGLGPVGLCASVSLIDMLETQRLQYQIIAVDPVESRRDKAQTIYDKIKSSGSASGKFAALSIEEARETVKTWTAGTGCTAVLEVVGNNSALSLAYDLVRAFGVITSVGVHGSPAVPFVGSQLYNKNVSFDFGRCPARAMFPMAFDLLVKRQDIFGSVGDSASLVEKVVSADEAVEYYAAFNDSKIGKVLFDMQV